MEKNQLAQRIRAFRKLKGHTQLEFAELLGVSVAILGSVERGTRKIDMKLIGRISEVLGVSVEELVTSDSNKKGV